MSVTLVLAGWQLSTPAAVSASAPTRAHPTRPAEYTPLLKPGQAPITNDANFHNMDYNGGPVMPSNTDYMYLWSPSGEGAYPPGFINGIAQYFSDLQHDSGGHGNVDSVSSQYQDLTGAFALNHTTFGGIIVDERAYPASQCPTGPANPYVGPDETSVTNCLTDAQIQSQITSGVGEIHFPTDFSHEYFLLTPPGVESCFTNDSSTNYGGCSAGQPLNIAAYCAYHQNTALSPMLLYANMPFDATNQLCQDGHWPNNSVSDGELEGGLTHEHNESVTDPIPNDAWTDGAGSQQGEEVGDQCDGVMGNRLGTAPDGSPYNQIINGHFYWYQEEWSNQGAQCMQRLTPSTPRPVAQFSASPGEGLTMNFDASASSAPGGVAEYVWQLNAVANQQTFETTSPNFSYTFPSSGAYSVGLTVFESDGESTGNGGIVTTGQFGTTPGFSAMQTSSRNGDVVAFSALGTVSAQPVMSYSWNFGDGTTGYGQYPTHTYAHQGHYTVTLVMFSGVGSAFPGQGAAPISQLSINVFGR